MTETTVLSASCEAACPDEALTLRPALVSDVRGIKALVDPFARDGIMLPKTLTDLYENVRDFMVAEVDGELAGMGALHILWEDLAEIRTLAVHPRHQGKGYGKRLAEVLMAEAERLQVGRVFALTYQERFFKSLGFRVVDKKLLPKKIWGDCIHCKKFPMCDEIAVVYDFRPYPEGPIGPPPELPQVIDLQALVPGLGDRKD